MSNSIAHAVRVRRGQMFARSTWKDGERQVDTDYGIVTYDDDGNYAVTSFRLGFRSDHFSALFGRPALSTSQPLKSDSDILLDKKDKGHIDIHRDGKTVVRLDAKGRKAKAKSDKRKAKKAKADREAADAKHQAEVTKIRVWRDANDGQVGPFTPEQEAEATALVS